MLLALLLVHGHDLFQIVLEFRLICDLDNGEAVSVSACFHPCKRVALFEIFGVLF